MRWTLNHTLSALFALQGAALIWGAGEPPPRLDLLARVVDPGASARAQSSAKPSAQSVVDAALASITQVKIERRLDKPKRAPGPYMIFCKEERPKIVKANPNMSFGEVGKALGEKWRGMSDAQKAKYK